MLQHILQRKLGVDSVEEIRFGGYEACRDSSNLYLLVPIEKNEQETVSELEKIANHLIQYGDRQICQFLKTKQEETIIEWNGKHYCVLSAKTSQRTPIHRLGRKLSKFHYRGRSVSFQVKNISRIGKWKTFWEKRLDQMEKVWNDQLFQTPENEFERMFLESFPYYMGLAENAIQYLVDTELDDQPVASDSATVCHERFSSLTWGEQYPIKNPFHWVFDHCSRDLAEWTRGRYFQNIKTYEPEVREFFFDYGRLLPLSSFSWRLLYARLLFPIHFFECVEEYYITTSQHQQNILQERMSKFLEQSRDSETFLGSFYQLVDAPVRRYKIPEIDWLKK